MNPNQASRIRESYFLSLTIYQHSSSSGWTEIELSSIPTPDSWKSSVKWTYSPLLKPLQMLAQVLLELEIQNLVCLAVFLKHLSISGLPEGQYSCLVGHPKWLLELLSSFFAFLMLEFCEIGSSFIWFHIQVLSEEKLIPNDPLVFSFNFKCRTGRRITLHRWRSTGFEKWMSRSMKEA